MWLSTGSVRRSIAWIEIVPRTVRAENAQPPATRESLRIPRGTIKARLIRFVCTFYTVAARLRSIQLASALDISTNAMDPVVEVAGKDATSLSVA